MIQGLENSILLLLHISFSWPMKFFVPENPWIFWKGYNKNLGIFGKIVYSPVTVTKGMHQPFFSYNVHPPILNSSCDPDCLLNMESI